MLLFWRINLGHNAQYRELSTFEFKPFRVNMMVKIPVFNFRSLNYINAEKFKGGENLCKAPSFTTKGRLGVRERLMKCSQFLLLSFVICQLK